MREFKNRLVKKTTTMTVFCMDAVVNLWAVVGSVRINAKGMAPLTRPEIYKI